MENVIPVTFDEAVDDLNDFIVTKTPFTDSNLAGSGISAFRDVLAHNTQRTALLAKYTASEMSVASARLRSSLVSAAVTRGVYVPGVTSAAVGISVTLKLKMTSPIILGSSYLFLERGTTFKGSNDETDKRTFTLLSPSKLIKVSQTVDGYGVLICVFKFIDFCLSYFSFFFF